MFDVLISLLSSPNATTYNKANRKCDKKVQKSRIEQVAWGLSRITRTEVDDSIFFSVISPQDVQK